MSGMVQRRGRRLALGLVLAVGVALAVMRGTHRAPEPDWSGLKQEIRKQFPEVRQLSVTALDRWLSDPGREAPRVVDGRLREEFEVSHLPDAVWVSPEAEASELREKFPGDRAVVFYCSVGYRSSALAGRLMAVGRTNIYNLEGSIFAWANSGLPVYRGTNRVSVVHPYDSGWGRYLDGEYHSE